MLSGASGCSAACSQTVGVEGGPQLPDGMAVERADPVDHLVIVHQKEPPVLGVSAGGGSDRGVEDPGLYLHGHRVVPDPSHGPCGVERLVDLHGLPPCWMPSLRSAEMSRPVTVPPEQLATVPPEVLPVPPEGCQYRTGAQRRTPTGSRPMMGSPSAEGHESSWSRSHRRRWRVCGPDRGRAGGVRAPRAARRTGRWPK